MAYIVVVSRIIKVFVYYSVLYVSLFMCYISKAHVYYVKKPSILLSDKYIFKIRYVLRPLTEIIVFCRGKIRSVPRGSMKYLFCLTHLERNSGIPFRFGPLVFLVKRTRLPDVRTNTTT